MDLPVDYNNTHHTVRKLVREEYTRLQQGLCYYCNDPLSGKPSREVTEKPIKLELFPPGFLDHPVHLHHCHQTGLTIGSVHSYCNAVLWQYHGE